VSLERVLTEAKGVSRVGGEEPNWNGQVPLKKLGKKREATGRRKPLTHLGTESKASLSTREGGGGRGSVPLEGIFCHQ